MRSHRKIVTDGGTDQGLVLLVLEAAEELVSLISYTATAALSNYFFLIKNPLSSCRSVFNMN